jgi:hypothetical protein
MNNILNRPLSDMETDEVYFNEEHRIIPLVKENVFENVPEDDICHYSGLRSLSFYEDMDGDK